MRTPASPTEVREAKVGGRGRGPDGRPPGGGGGDGDKSRRPPEGNPRLRQRLLRAQIGLGAGAAGILMFFLALASAYLVRQGGGTLNGEDFIPDWKPLTLPSIVWLNTVILLISSITAELARRQMFHESALTEEWLGLGRPSQRRVLPWLGITLILGLGFLAGQYGAWKQLNLAGWFVRTNPSSSFFFLLTGAHAVHLLGGLIGLTWAAASTALARPMESRQIATDISAWYWHFMGLLWLGILSLMYFAK